MNYNQNDPIYKNTKLGFSNKYTLFSSGCYVFCLAYILGIDVIECNEKLKNVGAFMADETGDVCLLNHLKISTAFPDRIESVSKYDSYDNDACLEAINKNGKCIVKVQNENYTHFVTFIGNKTLFDSLGGIEKSTSTYPHLLGLRVVNVKTISPSENIYRGYDLNNIDSNKVAIDKLCDIMEGKYISVEEHQKIINDLTDKYAKDKKSLIDNIKILEDLHKQDLSWADVAEEIERKLKAILGKFAGVGVSMSVESDENMLAGQVSDYLTTAEADKRFVISVLEDSEIKSPEAILEALKQLKLDETTIEELHKQIALLNGNNPAIGTLTLGPIIIKIYKK